MMRTGQGGLCWQSILISSFVLLLGSIRNVQLVLSSEHYEGVGDECQYDIHCLNGGECVDATLSGVETDFKRCRCKDGFSGLRCSDVVCPLLCQNGGSCQRKVKGQLDSGLGAYRQDDTASSLFNSPNDFECKCHGYFAGPVCEIPYINCGHNHRCYNGGVCVHDDETKTNQNVRCSCMDGFDGEDCEDGVIMDREEEGEQLKSSSKRKGRIAALVIFCGLLMSLAVIYAPTFIRTGTIRPLKFGITERTKKTEGRVSTRISRNLRDETEQCSHTAIETSLELT